MNAERKATRYPVEQSVAVVWRANGQLRRCVGHTRDISSLGVFFYADFRPDEGSVVELMLTLPSEVTHGDGVFVLCKAKVVRVEPDAAGGRVGIAAQIDSYEPLAAA